MEIKVTKKEIITIKKTVIINGQSFDFDDVRDTLENVRCDEIQITNEKMGKMFLENKILSSLGNQRWLMGATKGPNFQEFVDQLDELDMNAEVEKYK